MRLPCVEVLPAYEDENGNFIIPNSENGGSWETFDPKSQVEAFKESNKSTNELTRDLIKMLKAWVRNVSTLKFKSYLITETVIDFLNDEYPNGAEQDEYPEILRKIFEVIKKSGDSDLTSYASTAYNRAVKAIEYLDDDKPKEASVEFSKIFGDKFPLVAENPTKEENKSDSRAFSSPVSPWQK